MWTNENRARYDRSKLRYPSDLTEPEWALIKPLIPKGKPGGNKQSVDMRQVVNGLMYILSTGCQWAAIPRDLAARSTMNRIHHELFVTCRELAEREASPTVAIMDSQSVKSAEKGGLASTRQAMMRARRSKERSAISR
jgi:transposase